MQKLQQRYPRQSEEEFLEFYRGLQAGTRQQSKNGSGQTRDKPFSSSDSSVPLTKEDLFKQNLQNNRFKYTQGWVLIDFPNTYEQARLLERELSAFRPTDEIALTELE